MTNGNKWLACAAVAALCYVAESSHDAYKPENWQASQAWSERDTVPEEFTIVRRRVVTGTFKAIHQEEKLDFLLARYGQ